MEILKRAADLPKRITAKFRPKPAETQAPKTNPMVFEALKKLEGHIGKTVEIHYSDMGKPKISIRPLLETPNSEGMRLGEHLDHHWIWWEFTDPVSGRNFTVKRVKDAEGNLIFDRPDVKFDEKSAQRI